MTNIKYVKVSDKKNKLTPVMCFRCGTRQSVFRESGNPEKCVCRKCATFSKLGGKILDSHISKTFKMKVFFEFEEGVKNGNELEL